MKSDTHEEVRWTEVITPKNNLLDINIREIWRYRDLIMLFVKRDFVTGYMQTILGPMWFLIQPLLTTVFYLFIFKRMANLPTDGIPAAIFYLAGVILWTYFAECLNKTSITFTANTAVLGKVYFPRLVIPISIVITYMIKFFMQFALFIVIVLYYHFSGKYSVQINATILLLPLLLLILAGLGLALGIIFSSFTTKYRDMSIMLQFGINLAMFVTTVFYPMSIASPGTTRTLMQFNPMSIIIEAFRYAFCSVGFFSWLYLGYSILVVLSLLFLGLIIFRQVEKSFMDTV